MNIGESDKIDRSNEKNSINKSYSAAMHECIPILRLSLPFLLLPITSSPIWRSSASSSHEMRLYFYCISFGFCRFIYVQVHGWLESILQSSFRIIEFEFIQHAIRNQDYIARVRAEIQNHDRQRHNKRGRPTAAEKIDSYVDTLRFLITATRWLMSRRWVIVRVNKSIVFT